MALATYNDLAASLVTWSKRTDLATVIPDLVALAEARIARDLRVRAQITNATLLTTSGIQSVAYPADFLEMENITITSTSPQASLSVVTPEYMDRLFPAGYRTGQPRVYTTVGDNLILGPSPDGVYSISLDYYARFPALSGTGTNWLLTKHPGIYLSACMAELCVYTFDDDRLANWNSKFSAEVEALMRADDASQRTGSTMRVRTL